MSASSRMFLEMRLDEQGRIEMPLKSKKELTKLSKENADKLAEMGETDLFETISKTARLEEYLKSFNKELRKHVLDELNGGKFECYGVEFSSKNGASRLNYSEDQVWSDLKEKLKAREELLKVAEKSKDVIFDSEGVEIPKITRLNSGEVLNVKF